jgi:chemotaxis signal transduction protein
MLDKVVDNPGLMDRPRRGGLVLRAGGELRFLPASLAVRIVRAPRVTSVPGAPPELVGIAVHEGVVVPVVAVGEARGDMVVCQHAGELVGIMGGEVVRTGTFDVAPDRPDVVMFEGERAPPLDIATVYARVQAGTRPGRWG